MPETKSFSGHSHPITRDYEVVRCDECKALMRVPFDVMEYECPSCGHLLEFELEEDNGDEV